MSKDSKSSYYDAGGIEVLDVIKAKLTEEQYRGYLLGNTIKYSLRSNFKGTPERDREKLKNYSAWLYDIDAERLAKNDKIIKNFRKDREIG